MRLVPLEELVRAFGHHAFLGYTVNGKMMMRVTRNADFDTDIDDSDLERDFSEIMKKKVESRAKLNVVRLEIDCENSRLKDLRDETSETQSEILFQRRAVFRL